jgi:hypothetical protein
MALISPVEVHGFSEELTISIIRIEDILNMQSVRSK